MLIFLSLLPACNTLGLSGPEAKPPPVKIPEVAREEPELPMPGGQLVRRQCFGNEPDDESYGGLGNRGQGLGGGGSPATTSRSTGAPPPAPPPAPPTVASPAPTDASGTRSRNEVGVVARAPAKGSSAPSAAAEPAPSAGPSSGSGVGGAPSGLTGGYAGDDGLAYADPSAERSKDLGRANAESKTKSSDRSDGDKSARREEAEQSYKKAEPTMDWGATVYLSNDDSMSLASAQRLLWAVQKRGPVAASEVRPHELLNYFSFDTAPVQPGETFSLAASARETDPGTLSLAFAVKGVIPQRKPLDLTLVLDRSGSMSAEGRMEYLRRGLMKMTDSLARGDRIDLVLFDDEICTPLENFVVGRDDMSVLTGVIQQLQPRGSTDLDAGLREGYRIADARTDTRGRNRRMMLISDALLNTGNVDPNLVSQVAKSYESSNIRLSAIGVGREFNDKVLDMLSEKGKGAYVYLGSEAVVDRIFGVGFASLTQTVAHDVRFALDLPPSLAMERFYGEEMSTNPEEVQPIHYYAGTTQLFLQDLKMRGGRPTSSDPVTLTISYTDVDTRQPETQSFHTTVGALLDSDSRNLDKGRALMSWTNLILARAMGGDPCGAPFDTWQQRVGALGADAEIGWLDGLTSPLCGARPMEPVARVGVPYKVRVDSDMPIAEVALACGGWQDREALSGSDTVASFSPQPGSCVLTLSGAVPMALNVQVPSTGADLRCLVRGGRMSCS